MSVNEGLSFYKSDREVGLRTKENTLINIFRVYERRTVMSVVCVVCMCTIRRNVDKGMRSADCGLRKRLAFICNHLAS